MPRARSACATWAAADDPAAQLTTSFTRRASKSGWARSSSAPSAGTSCSRCRTRRSLTQDRQYFNISKLPLADRSNVDHASRTAGSGSVYSEGNFAEIPRIRHQQIHRLLLTVPRGCDTLCEVATGAMIGFGAFYVSCVPGCDYLEPFLARSCRSKGRGSGKARKAEPRADSVEGSRLIPGKDRRKSKAGSLG